MVDDQRDPKERVTILAEQGDILTNERGTFLVLENGTVQRHEAGKRDPDIVRFDQLRLRSVAPVGRTARRSLLRAGALPLGTARPGARRSAHASEQRGRFRAELHNRITAPLYPLAFLVIDVRLSRRAAHDAAEPRHVARRRGRRRSPLLRGVGFVGTLAGAQTRRRCCSFPMSRSRPRSSLGCWGIARGLIIEPPAFITNAINAARSKASARRTASATGAGAMMAGTLARYFGMRFLGAVVAVFVRLVAAGRDGRLHRDAAAHRRHQGRLGAVRRARSRSTACRSSPSASCRSRC